MGISWALFPKAQAIAAAVPAASPMAMQVGEELDRGLRERWRSSSLRQGCYRDRVVRGSGKGCRTLFVPGVCRLHRISVGAVDVDGIGAAGDLVIKLAG